MYRPRPSDIKVGERPVQRACSGGALSYHEKLESVRQACETRARFDRRGPVKCHKIGRNIQY
eukprot:3549537-Pleurochrysis_carterae.AAC.5